MTDFGLKELGENQVVQELDLSDTVITDIGLKELAGLKSLKSLRLVATQVTEAGIAELRKALPGIEISK